MHVPETMVAARMHKVGEKLQIDRIPTPNPGPTDVLVRVRACGIVPNLGNVLANWPVWFPHLPLPPMPAIFGLDPAGEIAGVGSQVYNLAVGDRVYANPGRSCGSCPACRRGNSVSCSSYALQGYFACGEAGLPTIKAYPYGGLCQYMVAPATAIVRVPDNVTFDQAARFGYLGTAFSALRKAKTGPGTTILVNGISGTLGIGGALLGLARGVDRILGTGRDKTLLDRVKAIAPDRIEVFSIDDGSIAEWAKSATSGLGVDALVDCLGPGAPHETFLDAMMAVRRGGTIVNVGAIAGNVPVNLHWMMDNNMALYGSGWFTTEEGEELAALARTGLLDMSLFKTEAYPLDRVNEAISGLAKRDGGFSNYVINPN